MAHKQTTRCYTINSGPGARPGALRSLQPMRLLAYQHQDPGASVLKGSIAWRRPSGATRDHNIYKNDTTGGADCVEPLAFQGPRN